MVRKVGAFRISGHGVPAPCSLSLARCILLPKSRRPSACRPAQLASYDAYLQEVDGHGSRVLGDAFLATSELTG